jgi:hypothetical protein
VVTERLCTRRRAPPAAARRQHPNDVAGLQPDGALVRQPFGPSLVTLRQQPVLPCRAGLSAGQPLRPGDATLGDERHGDVLEDLQVALDALTARGQAGTATPPAEPVAQHPKRERPFQGLDGRVLGVGQLSTL